MKHSQTALLVIDMQADYIGKTSKYNFYPIELIDKINERIVRAVKEKETIIYVKNAGRRNNIPYVSDFAGNLLIESNYIIQKNTLSAFENPALLEILNKEHISKIEMAGIDGNCCVAASAIDALKSGFWVIFPLGYIGIISQKRFAETKEKLLNANAIGETKIEIVDNAHL
ncbi:isochorismatase family protein [bacterium D16-51]|nr:isochorismatase family protein [bacterium D16-59]RKI56684.1 isochorismatase family protein [bacterium D16-51]